MPGIAGIIGLKPAAQRQAELARMVAVMQHELFYVSGTYSAEGVGLHVGWVCHPQSYSDCQPIWNEDQNICLIVVGENFPDKSQIDHLKSRGHAFQPGNASALVHLYEEKGVAFLRDLNGWFSGVLIDLREPKAILFNDRYGLGRLYYHERGDTLYFASEAKSLLQVLPHLRQLDPSSLGEFFSCGCALQNRSLFSGIALVPGGSQWEFRQGGRIKKGVYFSKEEWEHQQLLSAEEYYEKLKATFARVLPAYVNGDGRLGVSLTGGLDSRMIMAWTPRSRRELRCYTFGGSYRDCTDVKVARSIAKTCQQPYEVITVGCDFLAQFPALAEKTVYVTDGAMDVSGAVELYVNQRARQIAPVRLTGNYGSELLRGNIAFKPVSLQRDMFDQNFLQSIRAASDTFSTEAQDRRPSFILFKQVPWHHYARLAVEQSQLIQRTPFLDNELARLVYQAPADAVANPDLCLRLVADGNPALTQFTTDRAVSWRPKPVVSKARRFYQELTIRTEYAYDYGMPQWLARIDHVLTPLHLERLFLGRHKFYHFRIWYRDQLSQYLQDMLLDSRTLKRPYFCGRRLEEIVRDHVKGERNYTLEIHRALTSEIIQRELIERN